MDRIDIVIIGAGVVGLAVAEGVADGKKDVYVIERHDSFGQETSSRNSEVIHSGIYYPSDSMKRSLCMDGRRLLYDICEKNGIPYRRTGKLIVARDSSDIPYLGKLYEQGKTNGVEDIKMLSRDEVKRIEPDIETLQAIDVPVTGIVDSHRLMEYFLSGARSRGADIVYGSEVKAIERVKGGYEVMVSSKGEEDAFFARVVINCAGLDSDTVASMVGIKSEEYRLSYCKGDYFRVGNGKNRRIKKLIYPAVRPGDSGLGIHATLDLAGGVRLGPDTEYLDSRKLNYDVDPAKGVVFYESVRKFLPFIEKEDLSVDTSGIRPKLQKKGELFRDFIIRHEAGAGLEGFINLVGIESPGLTASPSIARVVKEIVSVML